MSFVYPVLLSGLVLAGIPVLLHLVMRQKPRHLPFPAFRFLLQKHRTNQRKLRLRHLLLLALRLFLVVGICLALARPKVFSDRLQFASNQPVAAVLLFDTSPSMGYVSGGRSRLDEARQRGLELLDELPEGSRVAVIDTGEPGGDWLPTLALARERVTSLRLRPANAPVTRRLPEAYRLFFDLEQAQDAAEENLPRFLYVFSDRTQDSWDAGRAADLQQLRDRLAFPPHAVYVDVGVDAPVDVALLSLDLPRTVVPPGDHAVVRFTVRATGDAGETEVRCRFDKDQTPERKPVKLAAGQSQVVTFERGNLSPGPHQVELSLETADALPFNNSLFATFEVRGGRDALIVTDQKDDADFLRLALDVTNAFRCEVRTAAETRNLSPKDLSKFQVVCLLNVRAPDADLWAKLEAYVHAGGGLAVVPGGEELDPHAYNDPEPARRLLPARLVKVLQAAKPEQGEWKPATYQHPALAPFKEWSAQTDVGYGGSPPMARRYWQVEPLPQESYVVVAYADPASSPALVERTFDRAKVRGRVMLFTTPLDRMHLNYLKAPAAPPWNNYLQTWFYVALTNKTIGYLAGETEEARLNHVSGQTIVVPLPTAPRLPNYRLQGPGLSEADAVVRRAENQDELALTQAVTPGNYTLHGPDGATVAAFSVNAPAEESILTRVPPDQVTSILGKDALLPLEPGKTLRQALEGHWSQPVELFPWLMLLVLFALAVENLLANRFYRREAPPLETDHIVREAAGPATAGKL